MADFTVVTGGARSGKSSFALELCEKTKGNRCFIATCPVTDGEMADRIDKHRQERLGRNWATVEEELDLSWAITENGSSDIILVDCLTLWINNLLYHYEKNGKNLGEGQMAEIAEQLADAALASTAKVCFVTNEVGLGIVPDNELARKYRDLVGRCNRILASRAQEVFLVSCGLPLKLK